MWNAAVQVLISGITALLVWGGRGWGVSFAVFRVSSFCIFRKIWSSCLLKAGTIKCLQWFGTSWFPPVADIWSPDRSRVSCPGVAEHCSDWLAALCCAVNSSWELCTWPLLLGIAVIPLCLCLVIPQHPSLLPFSSFYWCVPAYLPLCPLQWAVLLLFCSQWWTDSTCSVGCCSSQESSC